MSSSPYLPSTDPGAAEDWEDTFRRYVEASAPPRPLGPASHTGHEVVTTDDGRTIQLRSYQ